ncbi:hypothetical protein M1B34_33670, partial [Pseudomonas sp. MAFF 302030]
LTVPFPIEFPTTCLCALATTSNPAPAVYGGRRVSFNRGLEFQRALLMLLANDNGSGTNSLQGAFYLAIGH